MSKQAKVYKLTELRQARPPRKHIDPFTIEITDDITATFGDPRGMTLREMVELEESGTRGALTKLVGSTLAGELLALDDFEVDDFQDVMKAWREHYDLGQPGDSAASST